MAISHPFRKYGYHTVPHCQDIASNVEFTLNPRPPVAFSLKLGLYWKYIFTRN